MLFKMVEILLGNCMNQSIWLAKKNGKKSCLKLANKSLCSRLLKLMKNRVSFLYKHESNGYLGHIQTVTEGKAGVFKFFLSLGGECYWTSSDRL